MTLTCGNASEWHGHADLVLTQPYAKLPECLLDTPTILSGFANRRAQYEGFAGGQIEEVGTWGSKRDQRVWVRGLLPVPVDLSGLVEDEFVPGRGWFPLKLPLLLLAIFAIEGMTIWDGFMGRGTVGKACQMLDMNFVGVDIQQERVHMAQEYLRC